MMIHTVVGADNTPEKAIEEAQAKYAEWLGDAICYQILTLSAQTVHTGGEDGYFYHFITVSFIALKLLGETYVKQYR